METHVSRRTLLRLVAGGLPGIALAACGQQAAPPAAPTAAPVAPTVAVAATAAPAPTAAVAVQSGVPIPKDAVTVQWWDIETPAYKQFADAWAPKFMAKNPTVKVEFSPRPPEWQVKMTAAMAAGTPPDVVAVFGDAFRTYQQQKQVIGLDAYLKSAKIDPSDFIQGQWNGMQWGGQQVAIPQYVNPNVIYFNRDLLEKAGVPIPTDVWTPDDMVQAARKAMQGSAPSPQVWGFYAGADNLAKNTCSLIWEQCGEFNSPSDPSIFTFTKAENTAAFQWTHDVFRKLQVGAITKEEMAGSDGRTAMFATGNVAISLDAVAALQTWKDKATTNWDMALLPKGTCGRGERVSMDGYIIPTGVKKPDASWIVLAALIDAEAGQMRVDMAKMTPSRKSLCEYWAKSLPGKNAKATLPSDVARPDPAALWPKATEVNTAINAIMTQLFVKNEIPVATALTQLQSAVSAILAK